VDDSALLEVMVEDVLGQLPAPHRELVELRIQGHEVAELARRTGRSKRTVERILQDVRNRLRQLLTEP
jgi:DNA-directed RNA polymerase specialized sigma24 family protein